MNNKPFAELTREELIGLNLHLHDEVRGLRKLFLTPSAVPVAQVAKEVPQALLADLGVNVTDLTRVYRERQVNFDSAPFDPDGRAFRMFPGGMTVWSGYPGAGKTTLIRQLVCHQLYRGKDVFVASLEENPEDTLVRLMMTAGGDYEPSADRCQWFQDAYIDSGRLCMWGQIGFASYQAVLSTMRYAISRGARHCVIDSLTCLDIGGSDWDGQRGLANELASIARTTHSHIHLVAHPRKPQKGQTSPDLADVAGSSDLVRLADNVVFVKRNVENESSAFDSPTQMSVLVLKQRHGTGMCGNINGWFHRAHRQFTSDQFWHQPIKYLPDAAYE